jgi:hypothetical protein
MNTSNDDWPCNIVNIKFKKCVISIQITCPSMSLFTTKLTLELPQPIAMETQPQLLWKIVLSFWMMNGFTFDRHLMERGVKSNSQIS